jgi:hypothetical protein
MLEKFIAVDRLETSATTLIKNDRTNKAVWHADFRGAQFLIDFLYNVGDLVNNRPHTLDELIFSQDLLKK